MAMIEINPVSPLERSPLHRRPIHWTGPWRLYHATGYEDAAGLPQVRYIMRIPLERRYTVFNVHQLLLNTVTADQMEVPLLTRREFSAQITAIGDYFEPLFGVRRGIMAALALELYMWTHVVFVWTGSALRHRD